MTEISVVWSKFLSENKIHAEIFDIIRPHENSSKIEGDMYDWIFAKISKFEKKIQSYISPSIFDEFSWARIILEISSWILFWDKNFWPTPEISA